MWSRSDLNEAMSEVEELEYEIKRLTQKCSILEREKDTWREEQQLNHHASSTVSTEIDAQFKQLSEELRIQRTLVGKFVQKNNVSVGQLGHYKYTLQDIRKSTIELNDYWSQWCSEFAKKITVRLTELTVNNDEIVQSLKNSNQGLCDSVQRFTGALTECNLRIKFLENEMLTRSELLKSKIADFDGLNDVYQQLVITNSNIKANLDSSTTELKVLKNMNCDLTIQVIDSKNENIKSTDSLIKQVQALQKDFQSQKDANHVAQSTIKALKEQLLDYHDMKAQLASARAALELSQEAMNNHLSQDTSLRQQLRETMQAAKVAQDKCTVLSQQQNSLLATHDSLQSDMRALLEREEFLRKELSERGTDKGDMQRRLKSIQDKLAAIERDHAVELADCEQRLNDTREELNHASKRHADGSAVNKELETRVKEQISSSQATITELSKRLQDTEIARNKCTIELDFAHKNTERAVAAQECLRSDREEAQGLLKTSQHNLNLARKQIEELQEKFAQFDPSQLKKLQREVDESSTRLRDLTEQNADLKDTIRRECEERTNMMIEISCLKDELLRLGSRSAVKQAAHIATSTTGSESVVSNSSFAASYAKPSSTLTTSCYPDTDMQPFLQSLADKQGLRQSVGGGGGDANGPDEAAPSGSVAWAARLGRPSGQKTRASASSKKSSLSR